METPQPIRVTAEELKLRFLRACQLKQGVHWEKIVTRLRQWAAVMEMGVPGIVRVEGAEQYLKALRVASTAQQASRERDANRPDAAWAIRATLKMNAATQAKAVKTISGSAPVLRAVRAAISKSAMGPAGAAMA